MPGQRLEAWNFINLEAISSQISYPLLHVYIQQAPDSRWTAIPYRSQPELELTEGSHLGYTGPGLPLQQSWALVIRCTFKKRKSDE